MHRLLVDTALIGNDVVELTKEAARHLKVIRPKAGERIELFDGRGHARIYSYESGATLANPEEMRAFEAPKSDLTLFACVTKGSRWDWTIEKAVELGVTKIVPVLSDRVIVRLDSADERKAKAERWRRIAEDAARQSDAVWLPEVLEPVDFSKALEIVRESGHVFAGALTDPPPMPLLDAIGELEMGGHGGHSVGIFVGPEGDFTPDELASLLKVAIPVSLGPTILRAETAAIFGISVLAASRH